MRNSILCLALVIAAAVCTQATPPAEKLSGLFCPGTGAAPRGDQPRLADTVAQPVVGVSSGGGLVLEHGVWHSGRESTYIASVSELKKVRDYTDNLISLYGKPVTAGANEFGDCFYIEDADRSSGIRVENATATMGSEVGVTGTLRTTSDYERYIRAETILPGGSATIDPVTLNASRDLGGNDQNYDPLTGAGQRGVEDGQGLNNIGLLVTVFGKVTFVGSDYFYIDDGYHARDFSIFNGVRVRSGTLSKPSSGDYAFVTGISSIMNVNGRLFRSVRPRIEEDIQITTQ